MGIDGKAEELPDYEVRTAIGRKRFLNERGTEVGDCFSYSA